MRSIKIFILVIITLSLNLFGIIALPGQNESGQVAISSFAAVSPLITYGEYKGTYNLPSFQGLTGVTMNLNRNGTATVTLYTAPGGGYIPTSIWNASLKYNATTNAVEILSTTWINQASGWFMVDFKGTYSNGSITGNVYNQGGSSSIGTFNITTTVPLASFTPKDVKTIEADGIGIGKANVIVKDWLNGATANISKPNVSISYAPSMTPTQQKLIPLPTLINGLDLEFEANNGSTGLFEFVATVNDGANPSIVISDNFTIEISPSVESLKLSPLEFLNIMSNLITITEPAILLEQYNQIIKKIPTNESLLSSFEEIMNQIKTANPIILTDSVLQNKIKTVAANVQEAIACVNLPSYCLDGTVISIMPQEMTDEVVTIAKKTLDGNVRINNALLAAGFVFKIDVVTKLSAQNVWNTTKSTVDISSNFIKTIFNTRVKNINISTGNSDLIINRTSISENTGRITFKVVAPDSKNYNLEVYNDGVRVEVLNDQAILRIRYNPTPLEDIDSYTVFRQDPSGNTNMHAKYNPLINNFILRTNHFSMYIIMSNPANFSDQLDAWDKTFVNSLFSMGIVSGQADNKFHATDPIKREEFASMIVNTLGLLDKNAKSDFTDVSSTDWFYTPVSSAYMINIMRGVGDGKFGVGNPIKREDAIVTLGNVFTKYTKILIPSNNDVLNTYNDKETIDSYATRYFSLLLNMGIIKGDENDNLNPQSQLTRGEASVMVFKALEYLNAQGIPINKTPEPIDVN